MTVPRGSLRAFLASARSNLQNAITNQQRVTIVMGNESADLDSITSAIVFAYLRSTGTVPPPTDPSVNKHTPPSQYPSFYVPVLNIPRADVKIRPELLTLLPHANLEPSHLITLDDLTAGPPAGLDSPGKGEFRPELTHLVLVDHNKLAGPLADKGFSDRVVGCIDHHIDEHTVPEDTGNEPRVIKECGSCTSLVVQDCRSAWDSLSGSATSAGRATAGQSDAQVGLDDDAVRRTWDAQVAKLAIASILIDTHALKDENKTTDVDRQIVNYLEAKINLAPGSAVPKWDRSAFYKEIGNAKRDLGQLTSEEILRKDYKQWEVSGKQLGISSVAAPLKWQIDKANGFESFRKVVQEFGTQRELDFYSIMASSTLPGGEFRRDILLWALNPEDNHVVERFAKDAQEELGLDPWQDGDDGGSDHNDPNGGQMMIWQQKQTKMSRKQVAPLMRKIIKNS